MMVSVISRIAGKPPIVFLEFVKQLEILVVHADGRYQ